MTCDIAIIGGGPAGIMAAEILSAKGQTVTVYDRMPSLGRKLLMAGRGGLNLTHSEEFSRFVTRYGAVPASQLLASLEGFPPTALRDWAEGLGQATFVGSSGRVFPRAMKASPLLRAWLDRLARRGVRFLPRHNWTGWDHDGALRFERSDGTMVTVRPDATVLALGGASWPRLGSDGAWVSIMASLGVGVTCLEASNCGVTIDWSASFRERFAGQPLKRIALSVEGTAVKGEAVITHTGLEGGAVYALSLLLRDNLKTGNPVFLKIDLRPDLADDMLAARLNAARPGESLSNRLRKAAGLKPPAINLLREVHHPLPRDDHALATAIKATTLQLTGLAALDRAISTAGGLAFAELDDHFMLLGRPGVFVAGEMLDWDAPTGGYLLQAALSTGRAAGLGILRWLETRAAVNQGP